MATSATLKTLVTLAAVAHWLLLTAPSVEGAKERMSADVIIVGAGIAGISAAKTLIDAGVNDVIILEATNHLGGRMKKGEFAGYQIELGANWLAGLGGKEKNPIAKLAEEVGLRTAESNYDNFTANIYGESGRIPQDEVDAAWEALDTAYTFSEELAINYTRDGRPDTSGLVAQRLGGFVPETPLEKLGDWYYVDYEYAEPPRVCSLKRTMPSSTFVLFGDVQRFVADPRGFQKLPQHLAESVLTSVPLYCCGMRKVTDPRLKYRKAVNRIRYSVNGATVRTTDGSMYTAKHVIVTVSIGVLQSKLIDFVPDLPAWKIESIYKYDMALFLKIFIKFPSSFWPTGPLTNYFAYVDSKRGYYPVWQHLEDVYPGSNILFVSVTDDEARRIERLSSNETLAEAMAVLRTMFGANIPMADDIFVSSWLKNPYFRGSFTNWPIGMSSLDFDRMKAPLGRLYFAGEGLSEEHNGYVQGGYLTGIEAAERVLACMAGKGCSKHIARLPSFVPDAGEGGDCTNVCAEMVKDTEAAQIAFCKTKITAAVKNATENC